MSQTEEFIELPLEDVIGDRFGRYSKYIIQERALPDVRDGLKPVQRRILFAMHEDKNTHDKNFRKAAKTVGTVIGNYHPHGDTSVYDAMVRLSQSWKMRYNLVEMHGNNGSIDGDPPAAMRYTEAKLAKITQELLEDIDKETVDFIPNFDDTIMEPVVFPSKLPNLLINGSTGISAGYATNMPPHNLDEVIDAVIMKMDKPGVTVDELMTKMKGPDFPTGGIVQGIEGIKQAFETGKGRVVVRGKATIEKLRGGREQIIITEVPYDVNKANLVRKIDELNFDRKVEGIADVRDESDRTGLRIVIDLRKDASSEGILNFLYKNTDLQILYHYNMVAIEDRTPKLLSLPKILDAYINHQKDVVLRQTNFDLNKAKDRSHIVDGLIKAISVLDALIQTIRHSKNRADAKVNIISEYEFSDAQAEAILNLQLYRLTNTDITQLTEEKAELKGKIEIYTEIITNPNSLTNKIKRDLRSLKKTYTSKRRTAVEEKIEEIKIDIEVMIPSEEVVVSITKEGYVKRTSLRSYGASNVDDITIKESDYLVAMTEVNTTDNLLIFTNKGKFICVPVHELPDIRWRDMGQHISNITTFDPDEFIVKCIPVREFDKSRYLLFFTKDGMIKKTEMDVYNAARFTRSLIALNLRKGDELINVFETDGKQNIFIATNQAYGLWFNEAEVSAVGQRALGVIAIGLKEDDFVVNAELFADESKLDLFIMTQRGAAKRMKLNKFEISQRARRGTALLRELKTKPHRIIGFYLTDGDNEISVLTDKDVKMTTRPFELPVSDRNSNGSFVIDTDNDGEISSVWLDTSYVKAFE